MNPVSRGQLRGNFRPLIPNFLVSGVNWPGREKFVPFARFDSSRTGRAGRLPQLIRSHPSIPSTNVSSALFDPLKRDDAVLRKIERLDSPFLRDAVIVNKSPPATTGRHGLTSSFLSEATSCSSCTDCFVFFRKSVFTRELSPESCLNN